MKQKNKNILGGILINPFEQTVKYAYIEDDDNTRLKQLYALLHCDMVEVIEFSNNRDMWTDENGLLIEGNRYFEFDGRPIAGRAIMFKHDNNGNMASIDININTIEDTYLRWLPEGFKIEPEFKIFSIQ